MRAAITPSYGPADVLEIREVPSLPLADDAVRIDVRATPVTAGDRRLRSGDFPGVSAVLGRLLIGITGPRKPVQGSMFAGRVVEVGARVTGFAVGDDVFGSTEAGAYAEQLVLPETGAIAHLPEGMPYAEAAAVPYGAGTAVYFLRDLAAVQPGERVLVLGAAGGVGRYAVQFARHLGAQVTGVCSVADAETVRAHGAEDTLDYRTTDFRTLSRQWDVIFDIPDVSSFSHAKGSLRPGGRYLSLTISLTVIAQMLWTRFFGNRRALFAIALPGQDAMQELAGWMADGVLRPQIAERYELADIRAAHAAAESGPKGEIVVENRVRSAPLRATA